MKRTLTRTENRWAEAALGGIFPSNAHADLRTGICDLDVQGFLTDVRSRVPYRSALGLRIAIWMVALAPIFVLHRFRTIEGLDPRAREALLAALLVSSFYPVRQLVMLLKAIGALLYGRAASVREVMMPRAADDAITGPRLIAGARLGRKRSGVVEEAGANHERDIASVA
jgi:hypothetical protein